MAGTSGAVDMPADGRQKAVCPVQRKQGLEQGLLRLQKLLASLPAEQRFRALQFLSETLRCSLLKQMELQHMRGCRSHPQKRKQEAAKETRPRPSKMRQTRRRAASPRKELGKQNLGRGICTMKSKVGGRVRYFSRAIIAGIAISSHCVRSEEEAKTLRDFLDKVSALRVQSPRETDAEGRWLLPRFVSEDAPAPWRFRATVDARRWVGRTLSSRQVASLAEALDLKRQLDSARQQGWPALRAAWIRCMQTPPNSRRFGHRAISAQEAEALAAEAERRAEEGCLPRLDTQRERRRAQAALQRRARATAQAAERLKRKLGRLRPLVCRLEQRLQARDRAARRPHSKPRECCAARVGGSVKRGRLLSLCSS